MIDEVPTIDTLERQIRAPIVKPPEDPQLGFTRTLKPCPNSGRISFAQIADLKLDRTDVDCDDAPLLITRKMVETDEESEYNEKYYHVHPDPTNDPSDYYGAFWGHDYDFIRSEVAGPNPIGTWVEAFSVTEEYPYPESFGERGVETKEDSDGNPYFRLYAYTTDKNPSGDYVTKATYLVTYIGRVEQGTKLTVYFEFDADAPSWRNEPMFFKLRGWSDGFFQGELKDYIDFTSRAHRKWSVFKQDIVVDATHRDLWAAFQQNTSSRYASYENTYFRNFQIWRT